jgi:hypothetical protein
MQHKELLVLNGRGVGVRHQELVLVAIDGEASKKMVSPWFSMEITTIMEIRYMKYLIKLISGKDVPIAPVHKLWRAELAILEALVTEQQ